MDKLEDLVEQASFAPDADGRLKAFGALVRRMQDMAYAYAYAVLGDFGLAKDIVRDAFVSAYSYLPMRSGPTEFPALLRQLINAHARRRGLLHGTSGEPAGPLGAIPEARDTRAPQEAGAFPEALWSLETQDRVVLLMAGDGDVNSELAGFLGMNAQAVEGCLKTADTNLDDAYYQGLARDLKSHAPSQDFAEKVKNLLAKNG